jgi:alkylation response protein AidB-like acyl-CoA dehydrogenase
VDLALSDVQRDLVSSFTHLLSRQSGPEQVRAAEPLGFDPGLWRRLCELGAVTMAVPVAQGGWGASMVELVLVAEQLGRALAPAPTVETQVAARLLAALEAAPARDLLAHVLKGERIVTLALHPPRSAVAELTPAGAVCDALIVLEDGRLLLAPVGAADRRAVSNLASAPLADVVLSEPTVLAKADTASAHFQEALDEWLVLTAAAVVGASAAAHESVCGYAAERQAFGAPIGSYQGVAHPLADDATRIDGARLLTQKAAWALECGDERARELAAMAFGFSSETAEEATYNAIHFHGGYGFMLEQDVQLHYRRVRGWARVFGDAEAGYRRAAQARYGRSQEVP